MMRKCPWCKCTYETKNSSARQCPKNPHRRKGKPRWVRIGRAIDLLSAIEPAASFPSAHADTADESKRWQELRAAACAVLSSPECDTREALSLELDALERAVRAVPYIPSASRDAPNGGDSMSDTPEQDRANHLQTEQPADKEMVEAVCEAVSEWCATDAGFDTLRQQIVKIIRRSPADDILAAVYERCAKIAEEIIMLPADECNVPFVKEENSRIQGRAAGARYIAAKIRQVARTTPPAPGSKG